MKIGNNYAEKIKVVLVRSGNRSDVYASVSLRDPELFEAVGSTTPSFRATTFQDSLISHNIVFAAERSRKSGGAVRNLKSYF